MEYGLIGEKLSHSFSAEIHGMLGAYNYNLKELSPSEIGDFLRARNFSGINVTIPYKQTVMPYLDVISKEAEQIGAVNTIVNRGGTLYGYNTDIDGLKALLYRIGGVKGEKVLILGTGGTSKTAYAAAVALGASEIYKVSRSAALGAVSYDEAYEKHVDADVIINTTPCGMYPDITASPLDLARFEHIRAVADVVYNPLRTRLSLQAEELGIRTECGLYMLVKQALAAATLFIGTEYSEALTEKIYRRILAEKQSIVLIGMPTCGKTTVGKTIAKHLFRTFYDTDSIAEAISGASPADYIEQYGERSFRTLETEAVKKAAAECGCVIATGGGAILSEENVRLLRQNGRLYFLDRAPEKLFPSADRPLTDSRQALERKYKERYGLYISAADEVINADGSPEEIAEETEGRHLR